MFVVGGGGGGSAVQVVQLVRFLLVLQHFPQHQLDRGEGVLVTVVTLRIPLYFPLEVGAYK